MINFAEYLPVGKENAISAERLRARIGVKNDREVRQCVGAARLSGQLICSGNAGYYIPATREEVREYVNRIEAQARSMFAILKTARAVLNGDDDSFFNNAAVAEGADQVHDQDQERPLPATHEKVLPPADRMQKLRERLRS